MQSQGEMNKLTNHIFEYYTRNYTDIIDALKRSEYDDTTY